MADAPPYFPFYPNDFTSDDKVEAMTTLAVGAYTLLLCKAWRQTPAGSLPDDDVTLAKWARVSAAVWAKIKLMVLAPFTLTDGRWVQGRMVKEYNKAMALIQRRSDAGRAGAKQMLSNRQANAEQPSTTHGGACGSVLSPSGISEGSSSSGGAGGLPPMPPTLAASPDFESAWVTYTIVRREKGWPEMLPGELQAQWCRLLGWGVERATRAVLKAAAHGWKTIEERDGGSYANGTGSYGGGAGAGGNGTAGSRGHRAGKRGREFAEPDAPLPIVDPKAG